MLYKLKKTDYILAFFSLVFLAVGCSTKKDKAINRGFHAMTTKYNVMYNGQVAFDDAKKQLNANYEDNFFEQLPIEPLKKEELALPGAQGSSDQSTGLFDRAEEKAIKAIQKHSMNIGGTEKNKQIDEAYLLLGKSRYYSQRFLPAMEAFNYVIKNYPKASLISETKIWKAKTFVRINNETSAIQILDKLLKNESALSELEAEHAHTVMAMAYEQIDSVNQVVYHLKKAVRTDENKEQAARNLFILGQIFAQQEKYSLSDKAYNKVIDMRRIPYKYRIYAEIEKTKNHADSTNVNVSIERLNKLGKNWENKQYLDAIYYQIGVLNEEQNKIDIAEENYITSIHVEGAKRFQKGLSYEKLGDIYFDNANFVVAGAYYDSVLDLSRNDKSKRIRVLRRKRKSLKEVLDNEKIAAKTDSILNLVNMDSIGRQEYFQAYVDKLVKEQKEKEKAQKAMNNKYGAIEDPFENVKGSSGGGKFYFYNKQVANIGKQRFQQIWGDRPYEPNWRLSEKKVENKPGVNTTSQQFEVASVLDSEKFKVETYLNRIPKDSTQIDSIVKIRNKAYYELGLIYKEQFEEYELASYRFEDLLSFKPSERYIVPTKYHLYKIYVLLGQNTASNKFKNDILINHPDSKYAYLILHPDEALAFNDENDPVKVYERVYKEYQNKKYPEVLEKTQKAIQMYEGLPILAKFELLRAYTIGKTEGMDAFKTALEYVAMNYPTSEEGKKAVEIINSLKKLKTK